MSAVPLHKLRAMARSRSSLPHEPGSATGLPTYGSSEMAGELTRTRTLSPELWTKLPEDMIRIFIHKVLVDLPFARHWSFCRDSSRWKDFLLSNRYLVYYKMGECKFYNPRRRKWEPVSLEFCPHAQKECFEHLRLVSADTGLLTFFDELNVQYFVCNLLTQRYRKLGRQRNLRKLSGSASLVAEVHSYELMSTTLRSPAAARSVAIDPDVVVHHGYIKAANEKPFQLITSRCGKRALVIVDPRIPDVLKLNAHSQGEFWSIVNGPTLQSPQALILGFATDPEVLNLLIYDLTKKQCFWMTTPSVVLQAIKSTGKVLAICLDREAQMKFFEVDGTGLEMKMVESPSPTLPPSLQTVCETLFVPMDLERWPNQRHLLTLVYSAEEDSVDYFVESISSKNRLHENWVCNDLQRWHRINETSGGRPPTGIMHHHDLYVFKPSAAGPP